MIQSVDSDVEITSTGGVKQGRTMAPILFLIFMQAAIKVINAQADYRKLQNKTREDIFSLEDRSGLEKAWNHSNSRPHSLLMMGLSFSNLERNCRKL